MGPDNQGDAVALAVREPLAVVFPAPEEDWSVEYSYDATPAQEALVTEWLGHGRYLRNAAADLATTTPASRARTALDTFVAEHPFLFALPPTALAACTDELLREWTALPTTPRASRKRSVQGVVLGPDDFELTPRATIVAANAGEIMVHFDEGPPEPFPAAIEFRRDPAAPAGRRDTVVLSYRGVRSDA